METNSQRFQVETFNRKGESVEVEKFDGILDLMRNLHNTAGVDYSLNVIEWALDLKFEGKQDLVIGEPGGFSEKWSRIG